MKKLIKNTLNREGNLDSLIGKEIRITVLPHYLVQTFMCTGSADKDFVFRKQLTMWIASTYPSLSVKSFIGQMNVGITFLTTSFKGVSEKDLNKSLAKAIEKGPYSDKYFPIQKVTESR